MLVSTTAIDITPHCPVKLCGYINDIRLAQRTQTAHAPIYAIALRLVLENSQLLILTMDILSIMKNRAEQIKDSITQAYSIKKEEIFIHAIHTHAGPSGFSADAMGKEYEDNVTYREDVISRICTGLKPVFAKAEEARAIMGKTEIHGFYDNRNDRNRYYDADAYRLQFRSDDQLIAELVNINVHSTVLGPTNMEISYDLIGTIREELHKRENIYPLLCIGTSADISNRHYREGDDFKELNRTAKGITNQLLEIQNFTEIDMHTLKLDTFSYTVSYDNTLLFSGYQKELEEIQKNLEAETDKTKRKLLLSSKDKFESKLLIHKVHKELKLSLLRFPELLLVTFPGELTSVFGKYIKEQAKTPFTCIMTCTNDHHGYFIEQDQYGRCYEATATLIPKGETEKMIKKLGELL